jgi:hypothetical protein
VQIEHARQARQGRRARTRRRPPATAVAAVLYVAAAVLVWWHLWGNGVGGALASGSLDPGQNVWWLAWVPHVLGTGHNPFFTSAMYFPAGVNVLANTSFLLVGLVLAPITVTAGPVAAFAVAVVLAPATSAYTTFVVFRRYVRWLPAAFTGGALYGFGPFLATDLRYAHLNLTVLLLPPLGLLALDRILVWRTGSPWRAGISLGLLVVAEFFVSVEMLALGAVVAVCGAVIVVAARARGFWSGASYTAKAAVTAVVVAAGALAYPTWWYLRGPRHFSGAVWGNMAPFSASFESFFLPHGELPGVQFISGGNGAYLGIPLGLVLLAGLLIWTRDRILQFAGAMSALCALLSLGATLHLGKSSTGLPMPAWPLLHLPVLSSAAAERFAAFTDLFVAFGLALVVDHVRRAGFRSGRSLATVTAAIGLVPALVVAGWPYPAHVLRQPPVAAALARLPAGSVVREYPLASGTNADGLAWQAAASLSYSVTSGYAIVPGRHGHAVISPPDDALSLVFAAASLGRLPAQPDAALVAGVRAHAFDGGMSVLAVLTPSPGGDRLVTLLERALGPPALAGGGALWLAPGASAPSR